ncbi:MFS transporter [Rathayibacter toxicus]|uniref:MFS transporter n=1 Tax=Rathayibacter toxicus TaxID=145458 RepID=UPI000CE8B1C7|nr:MFS transporter [Rathayibacter toxicus]PPI55138.1 MFS transporter [Rathayibacter toxicus]QOD09609.1 MFS transporter [Rathayibacter toxicus]
MSDRVSLHQLLQNSSIRTLIFTMLIAAFGSGMFLAGSTIFFTKTIGLTPVSFATGLAIASVVALLTSLPVGALADWIGVQRFLVGLHLVRATTFIVLAFVGDAVTFTVFASVQALCQQASIPILQALIGRATDTSTRTTTLALIRSIRNVGFSLGALAAAPLIATDNLWLNRGVMIGTGIAIMVAGTLLVFVRQTPDAPPQHVPSPFAGLRSIRDLRYLGVAGVNGILSLHMSMLSVGFPLWVASRSDVNDSIAPLLLAINTGIVILAQVPFSHGVNDIGSARRAIWLAASVLAASCITLAVAGLFTGTMTLVALIVAILLFTCGEMWHSAGSWEVSFRLAPESARSSYLSVFALGIAAQDTIGPLLFSAVVLPNGGLGWMGLALLFLLGAAGATTLVRKGSEINVGRKAKNGD